MDGSQQTDDTWSVAGRTFRSRLIVGTGKYKDYAQNAAAAEAAGAEIVTVALRRVNLSDPSQPMLVDYVKPDRFTFLPNTAGCFTGEDAVRTLRLAREAGGWDLVKLEVLSDTAHLYPDMIETLRALELLIKDGFQARPSPWRVLGLRRRPRSALLRLWTIRWSPTWHPGCGPKAWSYTRATGRRLNASTSPSRTRTGAAGSWWRSRPTAPAMPRWRALATATGYGSSSCAVSDGNTCGSGAPTCSVTRRAMSPGSALRSAGPPRQIPSARTRPCQSQRWT